MIEKMATLLKADRLLKCGEISYEFGIIHGSVHKMLTQYLGMRKLSARWMPHMLSKNEKYRRMDNCRQLLRRYDSEQDSMLNRIVAIDET